MSLRNLLALVRREEARRNKLNANKEKIRSLSCRSTSATSFETLPCTKIKKRKKRNLLLLNFIKMKD